MSAQILDGKKLAAKIRENLKQKITGLKQKPRLAVILTGDNEASRVYVNAKQKAAREIGIESDLYRFDAQVKAEEIAALITKLNHDSSVNGILVQLPLPRPADEEHLLELIDPAKDVDGFHPYNIGLLQNNSPKAMIAATPKGIMRLLQETGVPLEGKNALIIGRSQIVGKPAAMLLLNQNCTVTIAHSHTQDLPSAVKNADIVVAACGCPGLIKAQWLKPGAAVIDVGINRVNGKLCGDIEFEAALQKAAYITPVPGGVGPMTIAMLLENTYLAYLKQNNK